MNKSLSYIVREPEKIQTNTPTLILLHGYGSNEQDLFSFATELPSELLIISAQAPISLGFGAYTWFEIDFTGSKGNRTNTEQAKKAVILIENLVDEICTKYAVNLDNMFMLGFSQGSILSYAYAFKNPTKITKFIALSGYVNKEIISDFKTASNYNKLDFFVSHGTQDQVLPISWAREIPVILEEFKIKYEYHEYPVGHGVSPKNFMDFKKWIAKRL